ncbi:K02A2.6-like [Cordylochernes scorpioides]|uniref:K02A2.6-like n=1 Tax=Cordylochernes scorpioides TaxID=51811 RepID=A0ABY6KYQ7_9ARAC|nr:K02A2.6-like [Cordylochernes scorpioides]
MKEQPYERLIQRIKLHLAPRKRVIPQRCRFLKRIQLENQSVSEYLRELRHLAMDCTFGEMLEVMLRDRFVAGIKSESLQKKLLQEDDDVTLDRVFSIAVSFELAEQNAKELQDGLVAKMDIVPGGNRKNEARRGWQHGPGMQRRETICFRCGKKNSHLAPACPHKTKYCFKCKRIGHLSRVCKTGKSVPDCRYAQDELIYSVQGDTDAKINLHVDEYQLCFVVDTGSPVTLMPKTIYEKYWKDGKLSPSYLRLRSFCGNPINIIGERRVFVKEANQDLRLIVVDEDISIVLLGREWLKGLNLDFSRLLNIRQKKVENEIDGMVNEGILQPIEYANWAAPIVPVLKKDGSLRICGDFRCTANKAIELDKYPLPSIDEIFSKLSGNTVFSSLDLSRAYLQVRLSEEAKRVVNINTTKGLFAFKRLPYGVAVAPNKFQREKDNLFADMSGVACYIDDILVAEKDHRDHEQKLELVFKRLQEKGLRLNKDKCKFAVNAVEYLGFKIDKKGLHPISSKIEAVVEAPEPTNNSKWNWTGEHRILFAKCKALLTNESVLAHYDATRELVLACDASSYGLGVVLSHRNDRKEETPIAFASRTLTEAERRIKRWSLNLSAFKYTVEFRKTDDNGNADALSRLPLVSKTTESLDENQVLLFRKMSEVPFSFQDVAVETRRDKLLSIVLRNVRENNWQIPKVSQENPLCSYYRIKDELSCEFGCLQWRERVVIPQKLRSSILNDLHEMHLGMVKMKMIARRICMPPSTISEWTWPEKPWHRLHLDLAGPFMGRMFMVLVDAYTKWLEIVIIKDITSRTIIGHLREIFARFGLPELLVTDNGRQFVSSEFEEFTKINGIRHTKTSPYNPSTNGLAERYVREFKNSLRKNQGKDSVEINLQRFLFAHRAFPQTVLKESPAELLMKRNLRSRFSNLIPKMAKVGEVYHDAMRKQKHFAVGSEVYFRNFANGPKWKKGRIMELLSSRHYLIEDEGRYVKRHINQLRPVMKKEVPEVRDSVLPGTSRDFILPGTSRDHPGLGGQKKTREEAPEVNEELKGAESSAQEDTPEPEPCCCGCPCPCAQSKTARTRTGPCGCPCPFQEHAELDRSVNILAKAGSRSPYLEVEAKLLINSVTRSFPSAGQFTAHSPELEQENGSTLHFLENLNIFSPDRKTGDMETGLKLLGYQERRQHFCKDANPVLLSRQDKEMELNQDPIGVKSDGPTETMERRQEVRESEPTGERQEVTGRETTAPLADAVNQLSTLLTRVKISDGAVAAIPPFDGAYSATQFFQTFDRKMEDASVGEQEKLLRLPNYLVRQPLELFRKLRLADRSYFQVRQILLDLYPESSEASFAKYFAMKLTGQANLETYYREKTAMGLQLGLPQEVILETLTEGLPFNDQRLVRVVPPENLGEWFRLVQRIHGPSVPATRSREDQPPTMSGPYHSTPRRPGAWNAPLPPSNCKFCGARHWHSECRRRPVPTTHEKVRTVQTVPKQPTTIPQQPSQARDTPAVQPFRD